LADLDTAATALDGDRARRVAALQAEAYQVASGLLLKADDPTLATVAADRSIAAAIPSQLRRACEVSPTRS
jgi:hypothetical protein